MSDPLPCIVCGRELEKAMDGGAVNQPYGGTVFTTHGHYGSTAFDPITGPDMLEITICDPCLISAALRERVMRTYGSEHMLWAPEDAVKHHVAKVAEEG